MAVTISRTNWIDDDGSGTTGTVINNAVKTELYNQIDAAFAALTIGGLGDAANVAKLNVTNTFILSQNIAPTNTANAGYLSFFNGGGANYVGADDSAGGFFGGTPYALGLLSQSPGGVTIAAAHASGSLRFLTGGMVPRLTISAAGLLSVSGLGAHSFTASGTGSNILTIRNSAAGTGNYAGLILGNDNNAGLFQILALSSNWATGAYNVASGANVQSGGAGGLSLTASDGAGDIRFYSGGVTERARFAAAGELLHGRTTALGGSGALQIATNPGVNWSINVKHTANLNGGVFVGFLNTADVMQGSITSGGTGTTTAYNTSSDQRLKDDDGLASDLTALRAILVHDFRWKVDGTPDRGVFAQEAHRVCPRAISIGSDGDDLSRPWMTDYSKFVPDLIVGWQQHDATVRALEARIAQLERN